MNRNVSREFVKVVSGNLLGYFLLDAIHLLPVPLIAFIQLAFFYLYYLIWSIVFDRIECNSAPEDRNVHHNGIRECIKVISGYGAGCFLLEAIHQYPVAAIAAIQMAFFYFYYLALAMVLDNFELRLAANAI